MMDLLIVLGGILGLVGFIVSLICVAMIAGFTRSTHTVQYVPHDNSEVLKDEEEIIAENEKILLDKVGKKKKEVTILDDLDSPLEEISKTEIHF